MEGDEMSNKEFVDILLNIVNNFNTIYAYGTWGQKVTETIINQKKKQYPFWYTNERVNNLKRLVSKNYFCFDCSGLIKAVLWGWSGKNSTNGGAVYQSNSVPDLSANGMINKCTNVSTNFNNIIMGELLWMDNHVGIYYKDNKVIECSPAFKNKVQITNISDRKWIKHGFLPWIEYDNTFLPSRGWFQKGDQGENVEKICAFFADKVKGNYYGDYVESCVKVFQKKNNLEVDGCIGPITLNKMKDNGFIE